MPRFRPNLTPLTDEQKKLVEDNLGLAGKFANHYPILGLSYEEMMSLYGFAMMRAARCFDSRRARFSTYAWRAMFSVRNKYFKEKQLMKNGGGRITTAILSQMGPEDRRGFDPVAPLDTAVEDGDARDQLMSALDRLDERMAYVLSRRFFDGLTLEQIGVEIGVTKEWVRQLEGKGLMQMRLMLEPSHRPLVSRRKLNLMAWRRRQKRTNQYRAMAMETGAT